MRLLDKYLPHEPRLPIKLDPAQTQQPTAFCGSYNQIQERNYKKRNVVEHEKVLY